MSDATYIELPPQPRKRKPFWKTRTGLLLLLIIIACCLAGAFSWWLAQGRVTSAFARVDSVVFTVEPETRAIVEKVFVQSGDNVITGQPLASIELPAEQVPAAPQAANPVTGRLDITHETESRLAQRAAQARAEEERFQQMHQAAVTEYVRAQLAMRAIDPANQGAWQAASQAEQNARARRDLALEDFERASKARAAVDTELNMIRAELVRQRMRGQPEKQQPKKPAEPPQPQMATLYAPVAGKIMGVNARQGYAIQPGQPIFLIMPQENGKDAQSWIQAWFPQSAKDMLKIGQKANIRSGDTTVIGHVIDIAPLPQPLPNENASAASHRQYVPVRIQLDNPSSIAKFTPGGRVECQIQTRSLPGIEPF